MSIFFVRVAQIHFADVPKNVLDSDLRWRYKLTERANILKNMAQMKAITAIAWE